MFCETCGRPNHLYCIHQRKLHRIEVFLILLYLIFIPSISLIIFQNENPFFIVSIVVSMLLVLLTIVELLFKKPYLATLFHCHMRVDRSSKIHHHYLPLCQRCLGIYIAILISIPYFYYFVLPFYVYLLLLFPMIVDGYIQFRYHIKSNAIRRFSTGFLGGLFIINGFTYIHIMFLEIIRYIV